MEELCEIFIQKCKQGEMTVSDEAMNRVRKILAEEKKKDNFGNGRAVRNLYEQAYRRHAVHYYENDDRDPDQFTADDIKEFPTLDEHRNTFGFV